jgi:hypothetical protein
MKYVAAAACAALIAGCSGVSTIPASSASSGFGAGATAAVGPAAKTTCSASKVMMPGVAGFIKLPACFGISGKMQFPEAPESGITITVTTSAKPFTVYHPYPDTAVILQWTFTDHSIANGTPVSFDYTRAGTTAPDVVKGPFTPGVTYHAVYQIPIPHHQKPKGGITFTERTVGHSVVGIPFPGTEVEIGRDNYEIFTSDPHA